MPRFSHRYGFDPERPQGPIVEDAPGWLRDAFIVKILNRLTYIDQDTRCSKRDHEPLGVKSLNQNLCTIVKREMDDSDWDTFHCVYGLEFTLKKCEWYQFYDCIEEIGELLIEHDKIYAKSTLALSAYEEYTFNTFIKNVNKLFEENGVGWRLNGRSHFETALPKDLSRRSVAIEERLSDKFEPARNSYRKAKQFALGVHKDPENSIKESVTALESVAKILYENTATFGAALNKMRGDSEVPKGIVSVMQKFYDYTNDEPGVRHGSTQTAKSDEMDAELALHLSAAFIRYLLEAKS